MALTMPIREIEYTSAGAISTDAGRVWLNNASGIAMTLADPDYDGQEMEIIARSAGAHTVTNTTGFNGGSTASDVATWTTGAGNSMTLRARGSVWYAINLQGVSLG